MAKLPALVVPVTIDSSGVDRGLNSVNSKLRKGSGRFGVGGFGSGGAAAVSGGGGGSVLEGFLAGTLATNIAQRARGFTNETRRSRFIQKGEARSRLVEAQRRTQTMMAFAKAEAPEKLADLQQLQMMTSMAQGQLAERDARTKRMLPYAGRGRRAARIDRYWSMAQGAITSRAGMMGIGLGSLYAANRLGNMNQTLQGMFGDIGKYEGSADYAAARNIRDQLIASRKSTAGWGERFVMGSGPNSWLTKSMMEASTISGNLFEDIGSLAGGNVSKIGTQDSSFWAQQQSAIEGLRRANMEPQAYKNTQRGII